MIGELYRNYTICTGAVLNLEYSFLLLCDSLIESASIFAHFVVDGRLFVSSFAVIIISDGPCRAVSEHFCSITAGFLNINLIQSGSIVAVSFWYRTRILQGKGPLGRWKLLLITSLLYVPHLLHIAAFVLTISPRIELEPLLDGAYNEGYASDYGLYGYSDITNHVPALVMSYLLVFSLCVYAFIYITRNKLLLILQKKTKIMNARTTSAHESIARALTIHAALPLFVNAGMIALTVAQQIFDHNSSIIEALEYDVAVWPALINPLLTLYYVRPYKKFVHDLVMPAKRTTPGSLTIAVANAKY